MPRTFIRRPDEQDPELVRSRVPLASNFIGIAPSYLILKLLEDAHECPPTDDPKKPAF